MNHNPSHATWPASGLRAALASLAILVAGLLQGCGGGGSGDDTGGGAVAQPQSAVGIWTGMSGTVGNQQELLVAILDSGEFFFARKTASGSGYDGIFGQGMTNFNAFTALNAAYHSSLDNRYVDSVTVSGTVATRTTINGLYRDPAGTAASLATDRVPFSIAYRQNLSETTASLAVIQGTYQSNNVFGTGWRITADSSGQLSGTLSGCSVSGFFAVSRPTQNIYSARLNLGGSPCAMSGQQLNGIAVVQYNANGAKTGIWIFATGGGSGTERGTATLVGNVSGGTSLPVTPPSSTQQNPEGVWTGRVAIGQANVDANLVVLPSGEYFYFRTAGSAFDVLLGSMAVNLGMFNSTDGTYIASQTGTSTLGVGFSGNVATGATLSGTYSEPGSTSGVNAQFSLNYNANTYERVSNLTTLAGTYRSTSAFGVTTQVVVNEQGVLLGSDSQGCTITGNLGLRDTRRNIYSAAISYTGTTCPANRVQENGVAVVQYNGALKSGLWILTAGVSGANRRATTFVGLLQQP